MNGGKPTTSKASSCSRVVKNEEKEGELKTHYEGHK